MQLLSHLQLQDQLGAGIGAAHVALSSRLPAGPEQCVALLATIAFLGIASHPGGDLPKIAGEPRWILALAVKPNFSSTPQPAHSAPL